MWAGNSMGMRVFVRSYRSGVFAVLTMGFALGGCANNDFDTSASWFAKPFDALGNKGGYTYSSLTDNALPVQPPPVSQPQLKTANAADSQVSADTASLIGGGIAIGMSECEVVGRLGRPTTINFGKNPNGYRTLVLTYSSGARPGDYRFAAGRLTEMDGIAMPTPPPEQAKKKIAKKKPAKPKPPPDAADKT